MTNHHGHAVANRRNRLTRDPLSLEAVASYAADVEGATPELPDAVRKYLAAVHAWADKRREARVLSCTNLVWHMVQRVMRRCVEAAGLEPDDAFQEGAVRLTHAANLFDERRGLQFATYATFWVKQSIQRACSKAPFISIPGHIQEKYAAEVKQARKVLSLPQLFHDDKKGSPGEALIVDCRRNHEVDADIRAEIADLLRMLPARYRQIVELRYLQGLSLDEIGAVVLGGSGRPLTRERVRQILQAALKKLRKAQGVRCG